VMEYRRLGGTELEVSVISQGCGGPSRLGQNTCVDQDGINALIRCGIESGINLFDTAAAYGNSEEILGSALKPFARDDYFLATKFSYKDKGGEAGDIVDVDQIRKSLDHSLDKLQADYIDVYQIHGLQLEHVDVVCNELLPELERQKQAGKIRFIGVTELWGRDGDHRALLDCVPCGRFDTAMVGYNLLNFSADDALFDMCIKHDLGVLIMFAVRRSLSDLGHRRKLFAELVKKGHIDEQIVGPDDPLGWILDHGVDSITEAGYRFAMQPRGVSTVLTGTSNIEHLDSNLCAAGAGPLPGKTMAEIRSRFGHIKHSLEK